MLKRRKRDGQYNVGRWTLEEHKKFIEALLKYGNDWKCVEKHVSSRSSTQARSHAQKFFVKIGKTQIEQLQLDFENNSLKSLNQLATHLSNEQMSKAIKQLNKMAFEKKFESKKLEKKQIQEKRLKKLKFHKICNPAESKTYADLKLMKRYLNY
jgi:SHAQKYF class myb-like DNA-binding protein